MATQSDPQRLKFGKARRLSLPAEFARVKAEGSVQRGRLLTLGVLRLSGDLPARFGFVASRFVGGAVQRNRVRRRLREIVRKHQREIARGVWTVTIPRAAAVAATYAALELEWLRLAERASILRP